MIRKVKDCRLRGGESGGKVAKFHPSHKKSGRKEQGRKNLRKGTGNVSGGTFFIDVKARFSAKNPKPGIAQVAGEKAISEIGGPGRLRTSYKKRNRGQVSFMGRM